MLCKCKLTIDVSNTRIRSVFGRAEKLRNLCAHPTLESEGLPFTFDTLQELVCDMKELITIFEESFQRERRVREAKTS